MIALAADDPRHATNAGYAAGCRCGSCRTATRNWHKRLRVDHDAGIRRLVDATGTRRRIQALMRLGYSGQMIALARGCGDWDEIRQYRTRPRVKASTAVEIAAIYERLSMSIPEGQTHRERQIISRTRNLAASRGWPPPLAWDDIDDPDEQPSTGAWQPVKNWPAAELLAEWAHLRSLGVSDHEAARKLGVTLDGLERAALRQAERLTKEAS